MRILGIDFGSFSVKAVEIDSAFGRFEVHEYHEIKLEPGETQMAAAQRLLKSLESSKKADRVAVALKTSHVTFRNLRLPTRDKKAVEAGVRFELDDDLPFPIDSASFDYSVISQSKAGTLLHTAAAMTKQVAQFMQSWAEIGLDADLVTTEAWALRGFLNRTVAPELRKKPLMLLQMGHERTLVMIYRDGLPLVTREIPWGGRDLTLAICEKYGVPLDQAENAKLDHGFVLPSGQAPEATPEQVEFSNTLLGPIQVLIAEIRQAELTCKNLSNESIEAIYLSGGTSLLPGLNRVIEEHLRISTKHVHALTSIATSGVNYNEQTDAGFLLAASSALCLVGSDRGQAINFRKGAFARQTKSREFNWATLRGPVMALGAICFCFFTSLLVQSHYYNGRLRESNIALEKAVKGFFGQMSGSAVRSYLSNTSALKTSINKELTKQRDLAKLMGPNPRAPLGFLKEISGAIPRDVVVDMTEFQVGSGPAGSFLDPKADTDTSATLTFLTKDEASAERLATLLGPKLASIEHTKPEQTTGPEGDVRWKVTIKGKPTEDSYGK